MSNTTLLELHSFSTALYISLPHHHIISINMRTQIASLPAEVLQSIWRHLSIIDLIHCQQVCTRWNAYLPGNDQTLHQTLLSPKAGCHKYPFKASWPVFVDCRQHLERNGRSLPRLKFNLDIRTLKEHYTSQCSAFKDKEYHPIIRNLHKFARLIHPGFSHGPGGSTFEFYRFEDLEELKTAPGRKDESWEQMLACFPAVSEVDIHLGWRTNIISHVEWTGIWEKHNAKNPTGITAWDFVMVIRKALEHAESELRAYSGEMGFLGPTEYKTTRANSRS